MLELSTTDVVLAQNKILTQQMEMITEHMANLPKQLHSVQKSQGHNQIMKCNFCGGNHSNGNCFYQNHYEEEALYMNNQGRPARFANNYHCNRAPGWKNNTNQGAGWKQETGPSSRQNRISNNT